MSKLMTQLGVAKNSQKLTSEELLELLSTVSPAEVDNELKLENQKLTPKELLELLSTVSPGEVDDEFEMEKMKEDLRKEIEAQN